MLFLFAMLISMQSYAQFEIELEQVASGLNSPVEITHAGDQRLFIVERRGMIRILGEDGNLLPDDFININDRVANAFGQSEQGLLGLAFHPNYTENGYFYLHYTANNDDGIVARYSVDPNNPNIADPESEVILMTLEQPYSNHNGGCLKFGPDGYLYIGTGDGGSANDPGNRSQNPMNELGKMLRIDIDNGDPYAIPTDNPFVNDDETLDEIWAIGLRNPWKYSFDRETGDLWIADVGQNVWEEINMQPANSTGGENYGWRCYEGFNDFNTNGCEGAENYTPPVVEYNHQGFTHCSVTGGFVYRGTQYPAMQGHYIYADYCSGRFWSTIQDANGDWQVQEVGSFPGYDISSFGQDINGELYVARLGQGRIYKINLSCPNLGLELSFNNTSPPGTLSATEDFDNYEWFLDGDLIEGANTNTIDVLLDGDYQVIASNNDGCEYSAEQFVSLTNIQNLPFVKELQISPNPFESQLAIQISTSQSVDMNIEVLDLTGKKVYDQNINIFGTKKATLALENLTSGAYILRLNSGETAYSTKIIKK